MIFDSNHSKSFLLQAIQRAERAHEQQLRRISSFMAREVRGFWGNIEKLFEFRLKSQIERKRKIAMDEHLVRRISFFFWTLFVLIGLEFVTLISQDRDQIGILYAITTNIIIIMLTFIFLHTTVAIQVNTILVSW